MNIDVIKPQGYSDMKKLLLIVFSLLALTAHADDWTGRDKTYHFAVGVLIGATTTAITKDVETGFLVGAGAGLLKEIYDSTSDKHTVSFKDFAVTALGAAIGAQSVGLIITPRSIMFVKQF